MVWDIGWNWAKIDRDGRGMGVSHQPWKASDSRPSNPVQSQLAGMLAIVRLNRGSHNISYVNLEAVFRRFDVPVLLLRAGAPSGPHGGWVLLGYSARNPNSQVSVDLKTKNHFPYFNFLKIKEPWIRDWKRKKTLIKERE